MEAEIAELESFIDSYVGDDCDEPIPSGVFTNSNASKVDGSDGPRNANGFDYHFEENFEDELLEYQKKQRIAKDDLTDEMKWPGMVGNHIGVPLSPPANIDPHMLPSVDGWNPGTAYGILEQYYPMYPNEHGFYPPQGEGLPPPTFHPFDYPTYTTWTEPQMMSQNINPQMPPNNTGKEIANNDLRHRLNKRSTGKQVAENGKPPNVGTKKDKALHKRQESSEKENGHLSWRKHDRAPPKRRDTDNRLVDDRSDTSSVDPGGRKNKAPPKNDTKKKSSSRHSSQSSSSESVTSPVPKFVSGRSKAEVRSWLKQDVKSPTQIEKQMSKLVFSPSKDLPRLIKSAQSFITSDKKLREVAEMVCSKGMKNPLSAENGAILCSEMSKRMINGTSFRTVILNIVQGHFKNRQQLMANAIKNPADNSWSGFVTFLTELYLKLRTSSNERLKALVNPVFECLFQMLNEKSANYNVTKCFSDNLTKVGSALEEANPQKFAELISLLRDNCILPSDLSPEARRNLLQSLEYYARGWKNYTLDNSYHDNCSSKRLAN